MTLLCGKKKLQSLTDLAGRTASLDSPTKKDGSPLSPASSLSPAPSLSSPLQNMFSRKKRVGVINESSKASEVILVPKSPQTKAMILDAIRDNLLFQDLPPSALDIIIDSMQPIHVPARTDIIRQDEFPASQFFVLEEGSCDVWVSKGKKGEPTKCLSYHPGSSFGELALLYSAPRAATVSATVNCRLWVMERAVYYTVKRNFTQESFVARHRLLDSVPALTKLSPHHRAQLVDALKQVEFPAGKSVFHKGDVGDEFYLVRSGSAVVVDNQNKVLANLGPRQYFGELALLGGKVRAATVKAETDLQAYSLSRADFDKLLGSRDEIWRFNALQNVPLLYNLSERQFWQLACAMESAKFSKGQVVFHKGDPGDAFYIIQEGAFTCFDGQGKELARIGPGSCFGELALLNDSPRAANVMALTNSQALMLSRKQFNSLLGNLAQLHNVWRMEALRKVPLLASLEGPQLVKLANAMRAKSVKAGDNVIKLGDSGDTFYVVEHGRLAAYGPVKHQLGPRGGQQSCTYSPGSYFGELALLKNVPRAATVTALTDASVLCLDRHAFEHLLGPLIPQMAKEAEAYLKTGWRSDKHTIAMEEVHALAVLGAGGFGQVLLVKYRDHHYALKCIAKDFVIQQGLVAHVRREKEHMQECESPFLVNLMGTNQDDQTLYMLMEAVMGGELFGYLQVRGRALSEVHARFYAASVILALQYLHDRDLVYRDLKPENLLIDLQGYVKMADFGFVKKLRPGQKTYTLCGTPEYLAPEVVMNKGHNKSADWWGLGVLLFEMTSGLPPFAADSQLEMFKKICHKDLAWPKHYTKTFKSLIDRLLEVSPAQRLGSGLMGAEEVKSHPWFTGFDWPAFEARKLRAPYMPQKQEHPADTVNFGAKVKLNHVFKCTHTLPKVPFDNF